MKRIFLVFLLLACGLTYAQSKQPVKKPAGPLDGNTYVIDIYLDGSEKKWINESDDIRFNGGKFNSKTFKDWGFGASLYEGTVIDSTSEKHIITFTCETKPNEKKEIMIWSGTVTGKEIEGTIELQTGKGKTKKSFNFNGALKEKKTPQKK